LNLAIGADGGPTILGFADYCWKKMAIEFKDYPALRHDLMNEPHTRPVAWKAAAQAATDAITTIDMAKSSTSVVVGAHSGLWRIQPHHQRPIERDCLPGSRLLR